MGWEYAWNSRKELIAHLCDESTGCKTIARKATTERGESVLWAVHELGPEHKESPGLRFIVCYLIGHDRGLYGYKEMGETMGPFYYSCPLSFLDMVPEPEGENVKEWRERVRKYHADIAERARRFEALKIGDRVKLRDGCTPPEVVLTSLKPLRGWYRGDEDIDGDVYTISKWHLALPSAIELNEAALEFRKWGPRAEAEQLLRQALAIDEQDRGATPPKNPHHLNNLCTVLILRGKLAEAKSLLARAWQLKSTRHDLASTRLLFIRLAIALLEFQPAEVFVGQLKTLLALDPLRDDPAVVKLDDITFCFDPLDRRAVKLDGITWFSRSLLLKIPPDAGDFLTAMASAMNDRPKLADLDRFPAWRNQPPIPLDTPWPKEQADGWVTVSYPDRPWEWPGAGSLNADALDFAKQGKLAEAESLLRQALAIDEQDRGASPPIIPHRLNLCTVIILRGKLAEAKWLLSHAWQLKCACHDLTSTRVLFVRLAIALRESQPAEVFVGQLKTLLSLESLEDNAEVAKLWDIACFVESLSLTLPPGAGDFLTALASAMNDRTTRAGLDRFPEWRNQPPIPLDAPWPTGEMVAVMC